MYLVCRDNPKFEETTKLRKAAKDLYIKVEDEPKEGFYDSFYLYGTRPFVLKHVNHERHLLSGIEYQWDYTYVDSLIRKQMFNDIFEIQAARYVFSSSLKLYGNVFIRPNSGNKAFGGQVFTKQDLQNDFPNLVQCDPWELCIVAPPKKPPKEEYRFFVHNEKMIWCRYLPDESNVIPLEVIRYAEGVVKKIREKDENCLSFVLDVGQCEDYLAIIEINSLSSSSFYSISPKRILELFLN